MRCPDCNYIYKTPILTWHNNNIIISGEFTFHMQDTHGFPHELLADAVRMILNKKKTRGVE